MRLKSFTFFSKVTHCVRESASLIKLAISPMFAREVVGTFYKPYHLLEKRFPSIPVCNWRETHMVSSCQGAVWPSNFASGSF